MKLFIKFNWRNLLKLLGITTFWLIGIIDTIGYINRQLGDNSTKDEWEMAFYGLLMFIVMQLTYYIIKYIKEIILTSKTKFKIQEITTKKEEEK